MPDSARQERLDSNRPGRSATAGMPAAIIRGHDRLRERVLGGRAATEGAKRKAVGVCKPLRGQPGPCRTIECSPLGGVPGRSRRRSGKHRPANCAGPPRLQVVLTDVGGQFPGTSGFTGPARRIRGPLVLWENGGDPVPAFVRDLIGEVLASCAPGVSCKRRCAHPLRAARPGTRSADRPVCTSMWITCAKRHQACAHIGEMLGIVLPGRARNRGLHLGERDPRPVDGEKNGIVHTPRRNSA